MLLYTDKILSIFMYTQTGDNQVCTLEAPSKSFGYARIRNQVVVKNYGKQSEAENFWG